MNPLHACALAALSLCLASSPVPNASGEEAKDANATLYAICDDACEVALNGVVVLETSKKAELGVKELKIAKGDVICAKCSDVGKGYGFACAVVFKDKALKPIASDRKAWKSYTPKDKANWSDLKGAKNKGGVEAGTNVNWKTRITQETDVACESIWAEEKGKPAPLCYLMYEVK